MRKAIIIGLLFGMGLAHLFLLALSPDRVKIRVFPWVCSQPCTLRVTAQVDPHVDNRSLQMTVDSGAFYSSSTVQLDGADAPYTLPFFWFKDLPSGEYLVEGFLRTSDGRVYRAIQQVKVN